jgi:hypothetical protein
MGKQNSQQKAAPAASSQEQNFEEEINLADYLRVLWRRKLTIILGSLLPAVAVGAAVFLWPGKYRVTYVYDVRNHEVYDETSRETDKASDTEEQGPTERKSIKRQMDRIAAWNLDEKNYHVLLDRFYSEENVEGIVVQLRAKGLTDCVAFLSRATDRKDLENFVTFEVLPPYVDASQAKVTDPEKLQLLRQMEANLLRMTITARPRSAIPEIASAVRDNFENVVSVYGVAEAVRDAARSYKMHMARIEEGRFARELLLRKNESMLEKLGRTEAVTSGEKDSNVILQLDVGDKTEYLPREYQIQAIESRIVEIQENLNADEQRHRYYGELLALNDKILAELNRGRSSPYKIRQFHSFLEGLAEACESRELKDYLNSYIRKIENRISAGVPVTQQPRVYPVAKGTLKKSAATFLVCSMISILAAFLVEGLQKSGPETA